MANDDIGSLVHIVTALVGKVDEMGKKVDIVTKSVDAHKASTDLATKRSSLKIRWLASMTVFDMALTFGFFWLTGTITDVANCRAHDQAVNSAGTIAKTKAADEATDAQIAGKLSFKEFLHERQEQGQSQASVDQAYTKQYAALDAEIVALQRQKQSRADNPVVVNPNC